MSPVPDGTSGTDQSDCDDVVNRAQLISSNILVDGTRRLKTFHGDSLRYLIHFAIHSSIQNGHFHLYLGWFFKINVFTRTTELFIILKMLDTRTETIE